MALELVQEQKESLKTILISLGFFNAIFFAWALLFDLRKRKYLHPIHFFYVGEILILWWGCVYAGWTLNTDNEMSLSVSGHLPAEFFVKAVLLFMAGTIAFLLGFYITDDTSKQRTLSFLIGPIRKPSKAWLWGAVLFAWGFKFVSSQYALPFKAAESFIFNLPKAAMLILGILCFSGRFKPGYFSAMVLIGAVEMFQVRYSLMREGVVVILIPAAIAFVFCTVIQWAGGKLPIHEQAPVSQSHPRNVSKKKKIKKWALLALSLLLGWFLIVIFFPATTLVKRGEYSDIGSALQAKISALGAAKAPQRISPDDENSELGARMGVLITSVAICVEQRDSGNLLEYDPLQVVFAAFIPRALWKDKPTITLGGWFNRYLLDNIGAYRQSSESKTSMALTPQGELYWAYGTIGMVWLLLSGCLIGKISNHVWSKDFSNIFYVNFSFLLFVSLLRGFEASFSFSMSDLFIQFFIAFIFSKILTLKGNVKPPQRFGARHT